MQGGTETTKPLTNEELREMAQSAPCGMCIWIKLLETDTVVAGAVGFVDGLRMVGSWMNGSNGHWLWEEDYGIKWLAYLEYPKKEKGGTRNG